MNRSIALAIAAVALTASLGAQTGSQPATAATGAATPQAEQYKRNVGLEVDAMQENIQKWNDSVFSFGELGFQEFETTKFLTAILRQNGFAVQEGVAGIPTAWTARWGSGKPVIALGSDVDCIPQASQKPGVAYHDPIIEGAPGHGEGHNSGMPLQIAAALAVKKVMEQQHLQGTLMLWPGIAEELVGAKVVALTVLDLLTRPELVTQAWDYFNNVQMKDKKYIPLIRPEDQPAIWLNKERMEKYRPEMRKYYYDPTKYKNYLEQLGIKYPTTEKPATKSQQQ